MNKKDDSFLSNLVLDSKTISKLNKISNLYGKRAYYLSHYKTYYLDHLKNEYNLIHSYFPNFCIIPEARIKGLISYNNKVKKISESPSNKDIYDIFANRYILSSVDGFVSDKYTIPALYKLRDFLAYNVPNLQVIPSRTKDYVSTPKHSTYQSLHITRLHTLYDNFQSETQLRSYCMHANAHSGAASHSNIYKQRIPGITSVPDQLEYIFDKNGFCLGVREKNFEKCFSDFFGVPYDPKNFPNVCEKDY